MAGLLELAALADQRIELLPERLRAQRQRILTGKAALETQIAEIDAARLRADDALLDQGHALPAPRQEKGRPGADQPAADDRDIRSCSLLMPSRPAAASAIGLTGA